MVAIFKREMRAYFISPIGYIFIGTFLLISGYFFSVINVLQAYPDISPVLGNSILIFLFLVPLLTMRLLAEERNLKTDQILLTSPVTLTEIVLGKFFAAACVFFIALCLSALYIIVLAVHGRPVYGVIFTSYIGFLLLGLAFISIGVFISSITENQLISAVVTMGILFILYVIDWASASVSNNILAKIIKWLSVTRWYEDFSSGLLSLPSVVYYLSIVLVFLFLTVRTMEKRRW